MKKIIPFLLLANLAIAQDLKPSLSQQQVETTVVEFLAKNHFQRFSIDDSLSAKVYTNFIEKLDRNKSYFSKQDLAEFNQYKFSIDDALIKGDLTAPFAIFNRYKERFNERKTFNEAFLSQPLNFSSNETYLADREDEDFAQNETELKEIWRKAIKGQALNLMLAKSTDSTGIVADSVVVTSLEKRFQMFNKRMDKLDSDNVFELFMNSFTEVIDPHTSYMIPESADQFTIDMSQSLEGIGARLTNEDEYVVIKDIIPGGPLFKSNKALKEDRIVAVAQDEDKDYVDLVGYLTDDAVKLIRGEKGSTVYLKLLASNAPEGQKPRTVKIIREKVKIEDAVATSEIIEVEKDGKTFKIGKIDIPLFYRDFAGARSGGDDFQSTTKDVKRFLEDFSSKRVDGVLIDLRNNGGGSLTEAIDLSGLFIEKGPVVQRKTVTGEISVEEDTDFSLSWGGPLVILQNRYSASASEIFAGAIQDYGRGLIVGEQSFGKGTVQQLISLDRYIAYVRAQNKMKTDPEERFGQLKLTLEKFYRITGNSTQLKGVMPDVVFPSPFDLNEYGESSYSSALPFDQIKKSNFKKLNTINTKIVKKINNNFKDRLVSDPELKGFLSELEEYKKNMEIKEYSLNYEQRKKENEEFEAKGDIAKKLSKSTDQKEADEDIYLKETELILVDLING